MNLYCLAFDGFSEGYSYTRLYSELQALGAQQAMVHLWMLRSSHTPVEIRNQLMPYLSERDRIFVSQVSNQASWNLMINPDRLDPARPVIRNHSRSRTFKVPMRAPGLELKQDE